MRGFQRGEAARLRLLFDDEPARGRAGEHDVRQGAQAGVVAQHHAGEVPGGVEQEHDEAPLAQRRERVARGRRGQVHRRGAGVEQHAVVVRVGEQRLHGRVFVEARPDVQFAVEQAQVREPAGAVAHMFVLMRVHQKHELGAHTQGRDRPAPTQAGRPVAAITHLTAHGAGGLGRKPPI